MVGARCAWSFSIVAFAVAQLVYNPAGHAQAPAAGEPEVHDQGNNVAPPLAPYPPPPYTPPAGAPPRPAPVARAQVAGPVVSMYADTPQARLQMQGPQQWRDVCTTPCNVVVDPAGVYRVAGGTIRPSDSFSITRPSGRVVLDVHYGSNIKRSVGVVLMIGGLLNCLAGGYFLAQADEISKRNPNTSPDSYRSFGIGSIVHGIVVAGIGIALSLSSTSVEMRY